ncbi:ATP-binding cassette subfamily B tetracycline resistance protein [Streptococcus rupicaprae]|uniref:ATP-binding cassette subfamily B tetracycline resistance protein n=1 Tax=Streptococcus rupicaprae TaxID=759619 RepID=A0ABV2FGZ4_9STRE
MEEKSVQQSMKGAIWDFIKSHWKSYTLVSIGLLISYGLFVVPTMMTQRVINQISQGTLTAKDLGFAILTVVLACSVTYAADYIWVKQLFGRASDYRFQMRRTLFAKLIHMRRPFYDKFRSGDMLTRFTNDTNDYSELLGFGVMSIFTALGTILFVLPAMIAISWQITILAALPLLVLGSIIYWVSAKQEMVSEEVREAVANLSNEVLEVVEGIRVTRAYGKKELGAAKFRQKTAALVKRNDRLMVYQAAYGRLALTLLALSTAIVMGLGGSYMQAGRLQLGDVVALQLYTGMLMDPMWVLSDVVLIYQIGKVAFGKLTELIETSDDMEADGQIEAQELAHIVFDHYSFSYPEHQEPVLKDISFELSKGQTLGIVGKTGSGKTTLVRQFLRQYPLGQGFLSLNGEHMSVFNRRSIEEKIGYVPQEHILFSKSVLDNIRLSQPDATPDSVSAAIDAAAFTKDLTRMSQGLDTMVGEKGVSISGGQKQRLSIARALLKQPELLILDDSLSAVDAKTERSIIDNIQALRQGKTNVIVSHRLSAVSHADQVLVLDQGKIVESGTPAELLANQGWYYEQYLRQQSEEGGAQ